MVKTYRPHDRARTRHHIGHLLNLLPIAQRVRHRLAFGNAADSALDNGDALFDLTVERVDYLMVRYK